MADRRAQLISTSRAGIVLHRCRHLLQFTVSLIKQVESNEVGGGKSKDTGAKERERKKSRKKGGRGEENVSVIFHDCNRFDYLAQTYIRET